MNSGIGPDYRPTPEEDYMNANQLEYFRQRLFAWRSELVSSNRSFVQMLRESATRNPDLIDQSTACAEMVLDFRTRYRQQVLIREIDHALGRIIDGEYGYCEITGEEIGLQRLMARPVATMCVEAQEQHERIASYIGKHPNVHGGVHSDCPAY